MEIIVISDKSFFKIGEVAKALSLETHVLRYWEKEFSYIKPEKSSAGQRIYKRSDIESFAFVKYLTKYRGFTLGGAKTQIDMYRENALLYDKLKKLLVCTRSECKKDEALFEKNVEIFLRGEKELFSGIVASSDLSDNVATENGEQNQEIFLLKAQNKQLKDEYIRLEELYAEKNKVWSEERENFNREIRILNDTLKESRLSENADTALNDLRDRYEKKIKLLQEEFEANIIIRENNWENRFESLRNETNDSNNNDKIAEIVKAYESQLEERDDALGKAVENYENQIKALKNDIESLQSANERLRIEKDRSRMLCEALSDEASRLQETVISMDESHKARLLRNEELKKQLEEIEAKAYPSKIEELEKELATAEEETEALLSALKQCEEDMSYLKLSLFRVIENTERQIDAIYGEHDREYDKID